MDHPAPMSQTLVSGFLVQAHEAGAADEKTGQTDMETERAQPMRTQE
jgi:hypothetical protein